jgi:hypothetical protein
MVIKKCPNDSKYIFEHTAENENLENTKWLLENDFSYFEETLEYAGKKGNLENIKWLL